MELGNKILELRKNSGLSQEILAEKLDVSRQTISKWELNESSPDLKQAKQLSKIFKVSIDELADNDVKDILTEKISNTERLAGLTIKILKLFGIFAIIGIIIFVLYKVIFGSTYAWFVRTDLEHECTLNNKTYHIQIKRDSNEQKIGHNEMLITEGDVNDVSISPYITIPDLEKYEKLYQVKNVIYSYFENNGGSCTEYIPEYTEND